MLFKMVQGVLCLVVMQGCRAQWDGLSCIFHRTVPGCESIEEVLIYWSIQICRFRFEGFVTRGCFHELEAGC